MTPVGYGVDYIPFDHVMSLQSWHSGGCDEKQMLCKTQCGTGNESASVQSDSKV